MTHGPPRGGALQVQLIMERDEERFGHSAVIRRLLKQAVDVYDPSRNTRHRFKGYQHMRLADELMAAEVGRLVASRTDLSLVLTHR